MAPIACPGVRSLIRGAVRWIDARPVWFQVPIAAALAVAIAFILGLVVAALVSDPGAESGLTNGDPFNLSIHNDSPDTVIVHSCINKTCDKYLQSVTLDPGKRDPEGGTADGLTRAFKITSSDGTVLGCMPFRFTRPLTVNPSFEVSTMVPCGSDGGVGSAGPGDWPGNL